MIFTRQRWLVRKRKVTAEAVRSYRDSHGVSLMEAKRILTAEEPRVLQQWTGFAWKDVPFVVEEKL